VGKVVAQLKKHVHDRVRAKAQQVREAWSGLLPAGTAHRDPAPPTPAAPPPAAAAAATAAATATTNGVNGKPQVRRRRRAGGGGVSDMMVGSARRRGCGGATQEPSRRAPAIPRPCAGLHGCGKGAASTCAGWAPGWGAGCVHGEEACWLRFCVWCACGGIVARR
jgi:hypothetical protein